MVKTVLTDAIVTRETGFYLSFIGVKLTGKPLSVLHGKKFHNENIYLTEILATPRCMDGANVFGFFFPIRSIVNHTILSRD